MKVRVNNKEYIVKVAFVGFGIANRVHLPILGKPKEQVVYLCYSNEGCSDIPLPRF